MKHLKTLFALFAILIFAQGCSFGPPPQAFGTPDEAINAIVAAARSHNMDQIKTVLGRGADGVLSSGDAVADRIALDDFLDKYDERHKLDTEDDGSVTLLVGNNDWPMPIPLVKDPASGQWHFDLARGKDEMINRRVGRNETAVVQVCLAITDAQREYAIGDPEHVGLPVYAEKFISDPGKKNGLYWKTGEGEEPSPLGALAATATEQGYRRSETGGPTPFHGYYFRMLTAQGSHATGGARNYIINGRMVGGFGVIAYPAEHNNSGVMTFIVNHEGVVYERDLGSATARIARAMDSFDPSPEWTKVESAPDSIQP